MKVLSLLSVFFSARLSKQQVLLSLTHIAGRICQGKVKGTLSTVLGLAGHTFPGTEIRIREGESIT